MARQSSSTYRVHLAGKILEITSSFRQTTLAFSLFFSSLKAHIGIKGLVVDITSGEGINEAHIKVKNVTSGRNQEIDHDMLTSKYSWWMYL